MVHKKVLFFGFALVLLALAAGMAFAIVEYEYTVEVYYSTTYGTLESKTYTLWASSAAEATKMATDACKREFGDVASCGGAIATGRTKKK